jgi:small subunit ribosomal protein S1
MNRWAGNALQLKSPAVCPCAKACESRGFLRAAGKFGPADHANEIDHPMTNPDDLNPNASGEANPDDTTAELTNDAVDDGEEDFAALLDKYMGEDQQVGQLVQATVVAIIDDGTVLLDIGDKAEGVAPIKEFQNFKGELEIQVGDLVEVVIERRNDQEQIPVSRRKARLAQDLNVLQAAMDNGITVPCMVEKVVNKGLQVSVGGGVQCFLPASQVSLTRNEDLQKYVGQELEVHVTEVDHKRRRGVVSRRKVLQEQQDAARKEFLEALQEGEFREGRVKNVAAFGVFVDLGPIDGLVPREEVAWERNVKMDEVLKPGTRYKFKVLQVDRERGRITLSRRQTKADPWDTIETEYPVGSTVTGKITNLNPKMAFVALGDGTDGKILTENLSWLPTVRRPSDVVQVGDEIQAVVLDHDRDRRTINLGLKQIETDPWSTVAERYPKGSRQTGTVTDFVDFGMFVTLDPAVKGLVHVSDLSHDNSIRDPKKAYTKGQEVEVVVLKIDRENRKIALGIKQLEDDPFELYINNNPQNSVVTGVVKEVRDVLVIVELARLVEGRLHVSEWDRERHDKLTGLVKVGDELTAKILKVEKKERRIALSRKKMLLEEERKAIDQYKKAGPVKATTSLGALMRGLTIGGVTIPAAPEPEPVVEAPAASAEVAATEDPIALAYQDSPAQDNPVAESASEPVSEPAAEADAPSETSNEGESAPQEQNFENL